MGSKHDLRVALFCCPLTKSRKTTDFHQSQVWLRWATAPSHSTASWSGLRIPCATSWVSQTVTRRPGLASRDQSRIARIGGHQLNLAIHESISHVLEGDRVTWFFLGGERVVWYNVLVYIYIYLFIYVYIYIHHCARAHTHTLQTSMLKLCAKPTLYSQSKANPPTSRTSPTWELKLMQWNWATLW